MHMQVLKDDTSLEENNITHENFVVVMIQRVSLHRLRAPTPERGAFANHTIEVVSDARSKTIFAHDAGEKSYSCEEGGTACSAHHDTCRYFCTGTPSGLFGQCLLLLLYLCPALLLLPNRKIVPILLLVFLTGGSAVLLP